MTMHRIAAIQMTSTEDVQANLSQAAKWIAKAAEQGARLVVLPEMFAMMGVDQMDKVKTREALGHGPIQDFLREQAAKYRIWLVGGTLPLTIEHENEKVSAACLLFDDQGNCVARYNKIHLFDVSLQKTQETYHESKVILAGDKLVVAETPVGKIGLAVCYDVRFPEMFRNMHEQSVEIVILPAAFTYVTGAAHWEVLLRARAIENQVYMIAAAQTGLHPNGRKTYGHSMIIDPWGVVKMSLPEEQGVVVADIDLNYLWRLRKEFPVLEHKKF